MKILVQDEWYTRESCLAKPDHLFIFGDNMMRIGNAGQAQIRGINNCWGVATKRSPGMRDEDFFSSHFSEFAVIENDLKKIKDVMVWDKWIVVFPKDGLGTGLSQLPQRAPVINKFLADKLEEFFGIGTNPDGTLFIISVDNK
jgi:hypothetical protein